MTNAWFLGAMHSVPQDENEVRSTVEPIREHGIPADEQESPDWNEFQSDDSGELTGLSHRVAGSETVETEQDAPYYAELASENHNKLIDDQVSSSGTAAAREMAGQFGHGTMQYALGIEPVIREGAAFGADYFTAHEMGAQEGSGSYMQPDGIAASRFTQAQAQAVAEENSRSAYANLYNSFLEATR